MLDGAPDAVKVACPVLTGGKAGDNIKGLPIGTDGLHQDRERRSEICQRPDNQHEGTRERGGRVLDEGRDTFVLRPCGLYRL